MKGVISSMHYQAGLQNAENQAFVKKYKELFGADAIANFRAVQGYDGMALIYHAVEATKGDVSPDALLNAMKGAVMTSPRGTFTIDPATRDVIQTIYVREGRLVDGKWQNVEIAAYPGVKDPAKDAAAASPK